MNTFVSVLLLFLLATFKARATATPGVGDSSHGSSATGSAWNLCLGGGNKNLIPVIRFYYKIFVIILRMFFVLVSVALSLAFSA